MAQSPQVLLVGEHSETLRRGSPRHVLRSLAYITLNQGNGGIIRDLSQSGLGVQAVGALWSGQEVELHFELLQPRVRLEARGRVRWADRSGQAGIQFIGLPPRSQRALRDWLFTQILALTAMSGRDSIFPEASEVVFSSAHPRAIFVHPQRQTLAIRAESLRWGPFRLSREGFSIFVDTLVLLCAVLLFSTSAIVVMDGLPAWPLGVALLATAAIIFGSVYQILFSDFFCGQTPGKRLALLATLPADEEEERNRFR
jgi:hypothetical protein